MAALASLYLGMPVLRAADNKPCDINLMGLKFLDLIVDATPDGYTLDHSDWNERMN